MKNDVDDLSAYWRDWKEFFRAKSKYFEDKNLGLLMENFPERFRVNENSRVAIFREQNKPAVDYYYSRNKWKSKNKFYIGDFNSFKNWYNKR